MTEELEEFGHQLDLEEELEKDAAAAGDVDDQAPDGQAPDQADWELAEAVAPPAFDYNDRLFAFGYSTSGKSEILNLIFSGIACQKLLLDTKPEFAIDDVTPAHHPEDLDWSQPIMHYQPVPGSECDQYERVFEVALSLSGPLVICVHEIQDLVDYKPQKAGRFLLGYAAKGARLQKGLLAGSQRPRLVPTSAITEARHILITVPQLARDDDNQAAAELISPAAGQTVTKLDLLRELGQLETEHGQYSFLWKDRSTRQLIRFPPIPDELRAHNTVRRLEAAG